MAGGGRFSGRGGGTAGTKGGRDVGTAAGGPRKKSESAGADVEELGVGMLRGAAKGGTAGTGGGALLTVSSAPKGFPTFREGLFSRVGTEAG